jgi:NADH:ubiquinone oxidoreductase subunit E
MSELYICVGSACHLKGSYEVIEKFKSLIKEKNLENEIIIKASFCLGECTEAVSVKFNDKIYSVVPDTAEKFFSEVVLTAVK